MRLGVHVTIAGGVLHAVERAERLGCSTMQIFSRSPRGGPAPRLMPEAFEAFDARRHAAGIDPLVVHGPYIINLASPDDAIWSRSLALFTDELTRCARLKTDYLVIHVGSHRGEGEAAGMRRVAEALNRSLAGATHSVMVLLENTAGSGQGVGSRFEELAEIRSRVQAKGRVGVCLDTAHLFAAGHPIHTAEGLPQVIKAFAATVGMEHLKVIHLNDSKVPFESRVDRHWHIGEGHIGLEAFRRIVNHPKLRRVPCILETPKSSDAADRRNLTVVRQLAGASRSVRRAAHARPTKSPRRVRPRRRVTAAR